MTNTVPSMKLYLISQRENSDYHTYDSAVVCAPDEETARNINPATGLPMGEEDELRSYWCYSAEMVEVKYIGEAKEGMIQGVVLASFNAG